MSTCTEAADPWLEKRPSYRSAASLLRLAEQVPAAIESALSQLIEAVALSALDPEVVALMLGRRRRDSPIDQLSPRELDVLAAMAEGKSNRGIAEALVVSQAAVEKHVTSIFHKLGLDPSDRSVPFLVTRVAPRRRRGDTASLRGAASRHHEAHTALSGININPRALGGHSAQAAEPAGDGHRPP